MKYIKVNWLHSYIDEPLTIYSELDDLHWELRKVEIFSEGRMGCASSLISSLGTNLSKEPIPAMEDIALDPQFEVFEISRDDFENIWQTALINGRADCK